MPEEQDHDTLNIGDLQDFRDRVLIPVAKGILSESEFQDAWVSAEPDAFSGETVVWARVLACGEAWAHAIWIPGQEATSYPELAEVIADSLQDWIAESAFAWGELRVASYVLPSRSR